MLCTGYARLHFYYARSYARGYAQGRLGLAACEEWCLGSLKCYARTMHACIFIMHGVMHGVMHGDVSGLRPVRSGVWRL